MEPIIFAALLCGAVIAAIANSKGYSFALWWVIGTLLVPVALVIALLLPPRTPAYARPVRRPGMKVCPQCAEQVQAAARVCRYCGHQLLPPAASRDSSR